MEEWRESTGVCRREEEGADRLEQGLESRDWGAGMTGSEQRAAAANSRCRCPATLSLPLILNPRPSDASLRELQAHVAPALSLRAQLSCTAPLFPARALNCERGVRQVQNRCQIRLGDASGRHTHEIPGDRDARIHQTFSVLYSKQESITPQPSLFYRFYGLMPPASFSARPPRGRHKNHALF